jgi:hypothetical protein
MEDRRANALAGRNETVEGTGETELLRVRVSVHHTMHMHARHTRRTFMERTQPVDVVLVHVVIARHDVQVESRQQRFCSRARTSWIRHLALDGHVQVPWLHQIGGLKALHNVGLPIHKRFDLREDRCQTLGETPSRSHNSHCSRARIKAPCKHTQYCECAANRVKAQPPCGDAPRPCRPPNSKPTTAVHALRASTRTHATARAEGLKTPLASAADCADAQVRRETKTRAHVAKKEIWRALLATLQCTTCKHP